MQNVTFSGETEESPDKPSQPTKNRVCRYFSESGYCNKGEACIFSHESKAEENISRSICRFFVENGFCNKGKSCSFSHDAPSKNRDMVCKLWLSGRCRQAKCPYQHPDAAPETDTLAGDGAFETFRDSRVDGGKRNGWATPSFNQPPGFQTKPDFRLQKDRVNPRERFGAPDWDRRWSEADIRRWPQNPMRAKWFGTSERDEQFGDTERSERFGGPEHRMRRFSPPSVSPPEKFRNERDFPGDKRTGYGREFGRSVSPAGLIPPKELEPPRIPSLFLGKASVTNESKRAQVCKAYQKGKCIYGPTCAYDHIQEAEQENKIIRGENLQDKWAPSAREGNWKRRRESGFDGIGGNDGNVGKRFKVDTQEKVSVPPKRQVPHLKAIGAKEPTWEAMIDKALKRIDLKNSIQVAIQSCKKCGDVLMSKRKELDKEQHIEDLEDECCNILASSIARKYPLHAIVSRLNAQGINDISAAPTWCISAIEGIENFVRGSELVCISIGLCVERRPVLGVIYNPVLGHLYAARRGAGTYFNKSEDPKRLVMKPIRLKTKRTVKDAIINNEFTAGNNRNGLALLGTRFRESGSLTNNFLDVLRKVTDGGFQTEFEGPWSVCAGAALVEEAGGVVTDLDGALFELSFRKREIVYGPPKLVEEMLHYI